MLSRFLIVLYILGVLLIAGFAKAQEFSRVEPEVTYSQFNQATWLLHIQGYVPQTCENIHVIPTFKNKKEIGNTIVVDLKVKKDHSICAQGGKTEFDLAFDLRTLLNKRKYGLQSGQRYIVRLDEAKKSFAIDSLNFNPAFELSSKRLVGTVKKLDSKDAYVLALPNSQRQFVLVYPDVIDMSFYKGRRVVVTGRFQQHVVPFNNASSEGERFFTQQHSEKSHQFIINGINSPNAR